MVALIESADEPRSSPWRVAGAIAGDIKLAHSVFAMPFSLLAAFLAADGAGASGVSGGIGWRRFSGQLVLVIVAMIFARTFAMLSNRLLDRHIDAQNPRTADRALPGGRLSTGAAVVGLLASGVLFLATAAGFGVGFGNWWPALLAVPVLAWLAGYPLCKRYTALTHVYLGAALAISPPAAALAVEPAALAEAAPWLIAAMVLCWVAGFDIIYALQDIEVDRAQGLHSIPSRFGVPGAMLLSRGLHLASVGLLGLTWFVEPRLGVLFGVGIVIVTTLLVYEHLTVARWGTSRMALAFFTLNGLISCVLGGLGILDILLR